jgi:hypothetical protein
MTALTMRESKRIWRHRQAAIESFIRSLRKSSAPPLRDSGILQRIVNSYHREWERYNHLIHANDRFRCNA